jgi:hypothetical protein
VRTAFLQFLAPRPGARRLAAYFGRNHVIRLTDQTFQFGPWHGIQPVQYDPMVASQIWGGIDVFTLDEFRERLRGALKSKSHFGQTENCKHFSGHFENKERRPTAVSRQRQESSGKTRGFC